MARRSTKKKKTVKKTQKGGAAAPPITPPQTKKQKTSPTKTRTDPILPESPAKSTRSQKDLTMGTPPQGQEIPPQRKEDNDEAVLRDATMTEVSPEADKETDVTTEKPATAVTPMKSPPSDGHQMLSDLHSEDSSEEESTRESLDLESTSEEDDVSFEDAFPFVKDKNKSSPQGKKNHPTHKILVETYSEFRDYVLGLKQKKMPSVHHNKATGKIFLERDGTSTGT
jgi:hypothetical protein